MMLDAPEVLGSIQRVRAVLTVVDTLQHTNDIYSDPIGSLEGVMMTLAGVNEDLREVEVVLKQYA